MNKLEFFKSLGFSEYESKTIQALIKQKVASPKEISEKSGVPQNKLYQILKNFENLGILSRLPAESKTYKLINLETFIENKINKKSEELKELKSDFKKIETEEADECVFSLIIGQEAVMNKLAENTSNVKKEVLGIQKNWKVWGKGLRVLQESVKRGVDIKFIGVINKESKKRALEWKKTGAKIKKYNQKFGEYPLRFSIFDSKEARITIGKPEIQNPKDYITIWTKSKPLINMLKKQFMEIWKESEKF
ncbi:TrmB family transcriptional regulator [Nanoarchaeota archaeon]